jgi:hypothetical protein
MSDRYSPKTKKRKDPPKKAGLSISFENPDEIPEFNPKRDSENSENSAQ